jgi:hypothetical protein
MTIAMERRLPARALAALALAGSLGCTTTAARPDSGLSGDSDALDDMTRDSTGEAVDGDGARSDADVRRSAGPMTMVMSEVGLDDERVCDFDGDGVLDNAIANLGSPSSEIITSALNAASFQRQIEEGKRTVVHFPWIDDLATPADPSTIFIAFGGIDPDDPPDRGDDFSGEEPYFASPGDLDACGEPVYATRSVSIDAGRFATTEDATAFVPVEMPFELEQVSVFGTVGPHGDWGDFYACGYATISDLGAAEGLLREATSLSALEVLLGGGAPLGLAIPGVVPDVDTDGDGLERILIDEAGHVESCVDGDLTEIAGPDCWIDPRIADGFSVTIHIVTVSALFLGRLPGWEHQVLGICESPPETSLFDER